MNLVKQRWTFIRSISKKKAGHYDTPAELHPLVVKEIFLSGSIYLTPVSLSVILPQVIVVEESSQVVCPITTKLVLDEDEETKEPLVQVHRNLVTKLKPHQVDGKDKGNQHG